MDPRKTRLEDQPYNNDLPLPPVTCEKQSTRLRKAAPPSSLTMTPQTTTLEPWSSPTQSPQPQPQCSDNPRPSDLEARLQVEDDISQGGFSIRMMITDMMLIKFLRRGLVVTTKMWVKFTANP